MPSEKKHRSKSKESEPKEPLKPLAYYTKDRVELTRQLFSNLKSKQIKNRLPPNLRNKSIERIQQICLDEILGISTKRLVSIINDTVCPENTDSSSDDSELECMSLEEISSDSETETKVKIELLQPHTSKRSKAKPKATEKSKPKDKPKEKDPEKPKNDKPKEKGKEEPKKAKEMTMLELLELQARARAIRSQLALEPVQKIELSDEENQEENETNNQSEVPSTVEQQPKIISVEIIQPEKSKATLDVEEDALVVKLPPPPPGPPSKPVKIKRNYRGQLVIPEKPAPQLKEDEGAESDSSDIISIDPNLETYFISDSDEDEEPPAKKSPEKLTEEKVSEEKETEKVAEETEKVTEEIEKSAEKEIEPMPAAEPEEGEVISESNSPQNMSEHADEESNEVAENIETDNVKVVEKESETATEIPIETPPQPQAQVEDDDDDIVNLLSDTEIDINPPDEENENIEEEKKATEEKVEENIEEKQDSPLQIDYDDSDVVDLHGDAEETALLDESDKETSKKSDSDNQSWEERWLSSSKNQKVLKTTKIASKVRGNVLRTRKSARETAKQQKEEEKEYREKIQKAEEGSMDQFEKLKGSN